MLLSMGRNEFDNSETYDIRHYEWKRTNRMTDIMTLLNKARKENKALQSTWNIQFCNIQNDNILPPISNAQTISPVLFSRS